MPADTKMLSARLLVRKLFKPTYRVFIDVFANSSCFELMRVGSTQRKLGKKNILADGNLYEYALSGEISYYYFVVFFYNILSFATAPHGRTFTSVIGR